MYFQVEYHESRGRKVHRKASSRQAANVFVPTKRTIFTPAANAHATPTFLQPVREHISVVAASGKTNHSTGLVKDKPVSEAPPSLLNGGRDGLPSSEIISHEESDFLWNLQPTSSRPSTAGTVSPPVESKRRVLEAANKQSGETSPTVKGMIESYNKRITERQSLLTSPFKYWISDISSSTDGSKKNDSVTACSNSSSVLKSYSASRMTGNPSTPDLLQGIHKSASGPTWLPGRANGSSVINTPTDASLDTSVDDLQSSGVRAFKIKRAKEEFFSRGNMSQLDTQKRLSNGSSDNTSRESLAMSDTINSSPHPFIVDSQDADINEKPPNTGSRRSSSAKRETQCREDENGLTVLKSASSESVRQRNPIRQSLTEPSLNAGKSSRGIFKLFRRSKEKDRKDMSTVQKLCRHSLEVDIERIDQAKKKRPSSTSSDGHRITYQVEVVDERSRSTLPRPLDVAAAAAGPSSRSCPASPVTQQKNRAAIWLARGKDLLKGRSPSPNIFKPPL